MEPGTGASAAALAEGPAAALAEPLADPAVDPSVRSEPYRFDDAAPGALDPPPSAEDATGAAAWPAASRAASDAAPLVAIPNGIDESVLRRRPASPIVVSPTPI